jgi:hypothetical protein
MHTQCLPGVRSTTACLCVCVCVCLCVCVCVCVCVYTGTGTGTDKREFIHIYNAYTVLAGGSRYNGNLVDGSYTGAGQLVLADGSGEYISSMYGASLQVSMFHVCVCVRVCVCL